MQPKIYCAFNSLHLVLDVPKTINKNYLIIYKMNYVKLGYLRIIIWSLALQVSNCYLMANLVCVILMFVSIILIMSN